MYKSPFSYFVVELQAENPIPHCNRIYKYAFVVRNFIQIFYVKRL